LTDLQKFVGACLFLSRHVDKTFLIHSTPNLFVTGREEVTSSGLVCFPVSILAFQEFLGQIDNHIGELDERMAFRVDGIGELYDPLYTADRGYLVASVSC